MESIQYKNKVFFNNFKLRKSNLTAENKDSIKNYNIKINDNVIEIDHKNTKNNKIIIILSLVLIVFIIFIIMIIILK